MKLTLFILFALYFVGCSPTEDKNRTTPSDDIKPFSISFECQNLSMKASSLTACAPQNRNTNPHWVVYFFHGGGGSAQDIFQGSLAKAILDVHAHSGQSSPLFVGLSLGAYGLVKPADVNELLLSVLPRLEKSLGLSSPIKRDVIGLSMGGHNALQVASFSPPYFRSVKLLCPALITFNPFDDEAIRDYQARHSDIDQTHLKRVLLFFRSQFTDPQDWETQNPFRYLKEGRYQSLQDLFISVGKQDSLGFEEGSAQFANEARHSGLQTVYSEVEGKHCTFDSRALAQSIKL